MPDTAVAEKPQEIKLPDNMEPFLLINRGKDDTLGLAGLDWRFELKPLRKGKNKQGPQKFAYRPVKPSEKHETYNWENWLSWLDKKQAVETSYQRVAGMSALWHDNETDDKTGVFDKDKFIRDVTEFSSRGETFAALEGEQEELRLALSTNIADLRGGSINAEEFAKRAGEIADRLNEIAETIAEKQQKGKTDEQAE